MQMPYSMQMPSSMPRDGRMQADASSWQVDVQKESARYLNKPILSARQWAKANKTEFMQDARRVLYGKAK